MYSPIRIKFTGFNDKGTPILYDVQLFGTVTIVHGDSGTGKTLMCTVARQMIANGDTHIVTYDTTNKSSLKIPILKEFRNKLILIDNADLLVYGELLSYILKDEKNHYILFRRANSDVELSPNYYAELRKNSHGVRELVYSSANPSWY